MANYYELNTDSEPKVIGVRDGVSQAEIYRSGFKDKKLYDRKKHRGQVSTLYKEQIGFCSQPGTNNQETF